MDVPTFLMPLAQIGAPGPTSSTMPATAAPAAPSAPASGPAAPATAASTATTMGAVGSMPAPEAGHLAAPSDIHQTAQTGSEISLQWKEASGNVTGFHVFRSTDGGTTWTKVGDPSEANFTDKGLSGGTEYQYKIQAYNAAEVSPDAKGSAQTASFFSQYGMIIMIVAMLGLFYVFMLRPQRKQEKKRKDMMSELKKGDKVMTIGGLVARVVNIDGDDIVLKIDESANVKATYRRTAIQEVLDRDEKK